MIKKGIADKLFKTELSQHKVEFALVQDIIKDAQIAENNIKQLLNLAARRERDFSEVEKIAEKVGVNLDSKVIEAGKFFRELYQKLK